MTDSKDFTTDSEASERGSVSSESSEEEFVVMIMVDGPYKSLTEDEFIDANLTHLNRKNGRALKKMLLGKGRISLSLHDLRPSEVLVEQDFKLKNDDPI